MDEVVISIAGEPYWLWRAVDQNGFVLDVLVQRRRDSRAAQRLMRKLLKSAVTPPRVMITDKLHSYSAARAQDGPLRRTSPAQGPEQSRGKLSPADRHNDFCRFTIKSRTSSTSLIPNPSLPTSAVRRASEPLRLGARSPRRALRPSSSLRKIASSARRSPNLTIPIKDLPTLSGMVRHSRTTQL
jgi:IS1 family transposase